MSAAEIVLRIDLTGTETPAPIAAKLIVACPDCGGLRYGNAGPHGPHIRGGHLVDCQGRQLAAGRGVA